MRLHPHSHAGSSSCSESADLPVVALVGRPNVGKSTMLAVASGRFAETVNAPGTTVGSERRLVDVDGQKAYLVDLPGTLSLDDRPAGGEPFWRDLLEQPSRCDPRRRRRRRPAPSPAARPGLP